MPAIISCFNPIIHFLEVVTPTVVCSALVFVPELINLHFARTTSSHSQSDAASGLGVGNIILGTSCLTLISGLNQGLDAYVSTSHRSPGKEHFALVHLARAQLLSVILYPVLTLWVWGMAPWVVRRVLRSGFTSDSCEEHLDAVEKAACDYLRSCGYGLFFLIQGQTAFRFLLFRGRACSIILKQFLVCVPLHAFLASRFSTHLGNYGLGWANSVTWGILWILFVYTIFETETSFEVAESEAGSSSYLTPLSSRGSEKKRFAPPSNSAFDLHSAKTPRRCSVPLPIQYSELRNSRKGLPQNAKPTSVSDDSTTGYPTIVRPTFDILDARLDRFVDLPEHPQPIFLSSVFLLLDPTISDVYSRKAMRRYLILALPSAFSACTLSLRNDCLILVAATIVAEATRADTRSDSDASHHVNILFLQVVIVALYNLLQLIPQGVATSASRLVGQAVGRGEAGLARALADSFPVPGSIIVALCFLAIYSGLCLLWEVYIRSRLDGFPGLADVLVSPIKDYYRISLRTGDARGLLWICFLLVFFVWVPEGVAVTCSGVLRACGRWKGGALSGAVTSVFGLVIGLALLKIVNNDEDMKIDFLRKPWLQLLALWGGVAMGCVMNCIWLLKLVEKTDFEERSRSTLLRSLKDFEELPLTESIEPS